jgi:regulator of RNase E activity RraA
MEHEFSSLATPEYGNVMDASQFIDMAIHPLWHGMEPIAGPAFTVQLASGDHLMLHAAIYEAPAGSIIVVDGVDTKKAVAGGNIVAIAKNRGIKGFVIDGVIRDLEEIEELKFPVYAKGVFPAPGSKAQYFELGTPIQCGGVTVHNGDIIVADMEGIAVIPQKDASDIYLKAKDKFAIEQAMTLDQWEAEHRKKIEAAIKKAR